MRLGPHYKVGKKLFFNKIDAINEAIMSGLEVEWDFFKEELSKIDWKNEPFESLDDLYLQRAKRIRDKYDYVVVLCSGGADSTNVIKTFINNNIHVDEVIASAPLSGLRNYKFNSVDTSHKNTMSETHYAQLPLVKELAEVYGVKVTINDYFTDILEYDTDEWLIRCDDWIHPSSAARYRFEKHKHLRDIADSGKSLAFVYGIDKPVLLKHKDNIYSVFTDLAVNVARQPFDRVYPNVDNVLFYWDVDSPKLLVKQAHQVANWIFNSGKQVALKYIRDIDLHPNESFAVGRARHSKYERAIVPCIYPSTHRKVFQAEKPESLFLGEHDQWFYDLHHNTRTFQLITSDTRQFFKSIDKRFINPGNNGFALYHNFHLIGSARNFSNE